MRKMNLKALFAATAMAVTAAGGAAAQTTVLSETWEAGTIGVINPLGGVLSVGDDFSGDNVWTVVAPTQDAGTGPHMLHEILDFNGSKWLAWQNDDVENAIDTQLFYRAPIAAPFVLSDAETVTFSVDLVPTIISTGGRRSATFYIGSDVDNCYRFQINFRAGAAELLTVAAIVGGVSEELAYGDPTNFDDIVVDEVYTFNATITPGATETSVDMEFTDGVNVIESSNTVFAAANMLPLATNVDYFAFRARQRTYQLWDNLQLEYTAPAAEGEGEGAGEGEGEGESFTVSYGGPSSATRSIGGSATFSVNASGNTGALDYQWFEDTPAKAADPISGANSSTLTLSNLTLDMSGTYYCEVTDDNETLTSPVFTLVVVGTPLPAAGLSGLLVAGLVLAGSASVALRRRSA